MHALSKAAEAAARQFLVEDGLVAEVAAAAAVFGRDVCNSKPDSPGLAPGLAIHVVLFAPLRVLGQHFGLDEAHHGVAENLEVIVHPRNFVGVHARKSNAPGDSCVGAAPQRQPSISRRVKVYDPLRRASINSRSPFATRPLGLAPSIAVSYGFSNNPDRTVKFPS